MSGLCIDDQGFRKTGSAALPSSRSHKRPLRAFQRRTAFVVGQARSLTDSISASQEFRLRHAASRREAPQTLSFRPALAFRHGT